MATKQQKLTTHQTEEAHGKKSRWSLVILYFGEFANFEHQGKGENAVWHKQKFVGRAKPVVDRARKTRLETLVIPNLQEFPKHKFKEWNSKRQEAKEGNILKSEVYQTKNEHMKRCSTACVSEGMQKKTYTYTPAGKAKIYNTNNKKPDSMLVDKCMIEPHWQAVWEHLMKLNILSK